VPPPPSAASGASGSLAPFRNPSRAASSASPAWAGFSCREPEGNHTATSTAVASESGASTTRMPFLSVTRVASSGPACAVGTAAASAIAASSTASAGQGPKGLESGVMAATFAVTTPSVNAAR
jgi:hypothetical protein